jgi:ssDNA-specific exonuclease RecJ
MKKAIFSIVLIGMLFILSGCSDLQVNTISTSEIQEEDEIITVTDKWVKRTNDRDLYLIGTEDEVFKIEDNIFIGKLNSSDIYNKIKIGHTYRITTTGVRSNFMSWYRNINTMEEVMEEKDESN